MLIFMTINTLLQTYFARCILNAVKIGDLIDEYKSYFDNIKNLLDVLPVSTTYYLQVGIVVFAVLLFESFVPQLQGYLIYKFSRSSRLKAAKKSDKTTAFMRNIYLGYETDFASDFARVGYFLIVGFGLAAAVPLLQVLTLIFLTVLYFTERKLFINFSKVPFFMRPNTIYTTIRACYFGLLIRSLLSFLALSDPTLFPKPIRPTVLDINPSEMATGIPVRFDREIINGTLAALMTLLFVVVFVLMCVCSKKQRSLKGFLQQQVSTCELYLEADEHTDNLLLHKEKIGTYTVPSYSWFRNPEWAELKSHFFTDVTTGGFGGAGDNEEGDENANSKGSPKGKGKDGVRGSPKKNTNSSQNGSPTKQEEKSKTNAIVPMNQKEVAKQGDNTKKLQDMNAKEKAENKAGGPQNNATEESKKANTIKRTEIGKPSDSQQGSINTNNQNGANQPQQDKPGKAPWNKSQPSLTARQLNPSGQSSENQNQNQLSQSGPLHPRKINNGQAGNGPWNQQGQNGQGQNGQGLNGQGPNGQNQNGEGQYGQGPNGQNQFGQNQNGPDQNGFGQTPIYYPNGIQGQNPNQNPYQNSNQNQNFGNKNGMRPNPQNGNFGPNTYFGNQNGQRGPNGPNGPYGPNGGLPHRSDIVFKNDGSNDVLKRPLLAGHKNYNPNNPRNSFNPNNPNGPQNGLNNPRNMQSPNQFFNPSNPNSPNNPYNRPGGNQNTPYGGAGGANGGTPGNFNPGNSNNGMGGPGGNNPGQNSPFKTPLKPSPPNYPVSNPNDPLPGYQPLQNILPDGSGENGKMQLYGISMNKGKGNGQDEDPVERTPYTFLNTNEDQELEDLINQRKDKLKETSMTK